MMNAHTSACIRSAWRGCLLGLSVLYARFKPTIPPTVALSPPEQGGPLRDMLRFNFGYATSSLRLVKFENMVSGLTSNAEQPHANRCTRTVPAVPTSSAKEELAHRKRCGSASKRHRINLERQLARRTTHRTVIMSRKRCCRAVLALLLAVCCSIPQCAGARWLSAAGKWDTRHIAPECTAR